MVRGTVHSAVDGPRGTIYSATDGAGGPSILLWMVWRAGGSLVPRLLFAEGKNSLVNCLYRFGSNILNHHDVTSAGL